MCRRRLHQSLDKQQQQQQQHLWVTARRTAAVTDIYVLDCSRAHVRPDMTSRDTNRQLGMHRSPSIAISRRWRTRGPRLTGNTWPSRAEVLTLRGGRATRRRTSAERRSWATNRSPVWCGGDQRTARKLHERDVIDCGYISPARLTRGPVRFTTPRVAAYDPTLHFITHHFSGPDRAIGPPCVCVREGVCVLTITSRLDGHRHRYLVRWFAGSPWHYLGHITRSMSLICQSSQSQD